jgi:hypothetical protein
MGSLYKTKTFTKQSIKPKLNKKIKKTNNFALMNGSKKYVLLEV